MHKVQSYEQIQEFIVRIRSLRSGFVTNFYWDEKRHPYWIGSGTFFFIEGEGCILLLHQNISFYNLYYIATSFESVSSQVNMLPVDSDIIVDIVCRGDGIKERNAFHDMDFIDYCHLYRMSHVGQMAQEDWWEDANVKYASPKDITIIRKVFQDEFDPLCEQLPSDKEIQDFIERNQLFIIKENGNLCGFLISEQDGVTWYLRYWYTSPDYRNRGIGAKLLKTSLIHSIDSKRQIFWVISENENAIKRYEHYGFKRENMNDFVMIKKKTN
ncbi:MAG: GNAT family N-acetyltransferase [Bacteroidaceae bacterium]|nr:GNAT family N-acetyltransferase [Bacteroidaceae bacterium]